MSNCPRCQIVPSPRSNLLKRRLLDTGKSSFLFLNCPRLNFSAKQTRFASNFLFYTSATKCLAWQYLKKQGKIDLEIWEIALSTRILRCEEQCLVSWPRITSEVTLTYFHIFTEKNTNSVTISVTCDIVPLIYLITHPNTLFIDVIKLRSILFETRSSKSEKGVSYFSFSSLFNHSFTLMSLPAYSTLMTAIFLWPWSNPV